MASFNVLTEPWIPAADPEGDIRERGILDTLAAAADLTAIVDPSPLVQFGLYRLLVAFVMDACGIRTLNDVEDLLDSGQFPLAKIQTYVNEVTPERFDLFHPETPFLQAPPDIEVTEKAESVVRLFQHLPAGTFFTHFHHVTARDQALCPAACARGLAVMAPFMTAGGAGYSPSINGNPPWYVLVRGRNLFETLVLNAVALPMPWLNGEEGPAWRSGHRVTKQEVSRVSLLSGLTWQPRRVRLIPGDGGICTYTGEPAEALVRDMYYGPGFMARTEGNWRDPQVALRITPKGMFSLHPAPDRELWRDTGPLLLLREGDYSGKDGKIRFERPLVVGQFYRLREERRIDHREIEVEVYGLQTDGKMKIFEWRYERLSLPAALAGVPGAGAIIQGVLETADSLAYWLGKAVQTAYPREGKGNKAAFGNLSESAVKDYWQRLHPGFDRVVQELVAWDQSDPNRPVEITGSWRDAIRQAGWKALDGVLEGLDADADGLFRQVQARRLFGFQIAKVLSPGETATGKEKGKKGGKKK